MPTAQTDLEKQLINQTLQKIISDIQMFVVGIDKAGKIIYVNPFFLGATGYSRQEVLGSDIFKVFIPVNKVETFDKKIKAIISNNYSMQSENPILKKDGSKLYVEWHNFPIDEGGEAIGVLSVGVDVTAHVEIVHLLSLNERTMRDRAELYEKQNSALERLEKELELEKLGIEKKVEERTSELNEEKARLLASINSFPYGLLVTDTNDNVVIANDRMAAIFDVKKVEWLLNDLQDFLSGNTNFMKYYGLVKTSQKPYLIKDIDLERKFLEVYIAPIFLSPLSNQTIGNVVLVTDITEQKIIERSKDEFFSIASHELRTPLTTIRGNAELIRSHYESKINEPEFNEIVDDIQASSQRLISLVNEFLNMSRLEQGKMRFKQEEVDVALIAQEVIKELASSAADKKLNLKFEISDKTRTTFVAIADTDRVREVLLNLVSNAICYTDSGGCLVKVSAENRNIKITVADTGKGIPLQNQNLLFRKFQQANSNIYTRDASRSTGLGLYISKLMVEAMRGTIYLEDSKIDVGSTFAFTLPAA